MKYYLLALLFSVSALGTDVLNVGIRVNLEYSDLNSHCKLSALNEPFRLAVQIKDGGVVRARLKKENRFGTPIIRDFREEELRGIEVIEEAGLMWIKEMVLSAETLNLFLFAGEGFGKDSCVPPQEVKRAQLNRVHFDFGVDSVGYLLPHLLNSNEEALRGESPEGNPFQIKLSLTQDRR
ncbi:MAG: hypothetical protein EBQ92_10165 [Proteobacteria bacterium]|nr:hypothetical protein [Pseudomonadota bacterium]